MKFKPGDIIRHKYSYVVYDTIYEVCCFYRHKHYDDEHSVIALIDSDFCNQHYILITDIFRDAFLDLKPTQKLSVFTKLRNWLNYIFENIGNKNKIFRMKKQFLNNNN